MGKIVTVSSWSGDRPVYYKPKTGKRVELVRINCDIPNHIQDLIHSAVVTKLNEHLKTIKEGLEPINV